MSVKRFRFVFMRVLLIFFAALFFYSCGHAQEESTAMNDEDRLMLLRLLIYSDENNDAVFELIDRNWEDGMIAPMVEIQRLISDRVLFKRINTLLKDKTGQKHNEFFGWMDWLWEAKIPNEPYYFEFKADLYTSIDEKFATYFRERSRESNVQLEEIVWGGVVQDGIPPLRYPELISAEDAKYLDDDNIVFGMYVNGIAKAYPKRILAWHEMFIDEFDGLEIAGVYCTLCGTVIPYKTEHNDVRHELGTSGFLFRSNKVMYDRATQTLWNTIEGKPILGPLADEDIELEVYPVVTTTWGKWKAQHPDTEVLSLNTGHRRDYGEGIAYQSYFNTDELMFPVPLTDKRLKNKDEVLIVRASEITSDPLAISINHMKKERFHKDMIGDTDFVVVADHTGASRAYNSGGVDFVSLDDQLLVDSEGNQWVVNDTYLKGPEDKILYQLPSHNMFWFAWFNTYPETRLVE